MIVKYFLFFTPTCPKCPKIKEYFGTKDIVGDWIDAATPDGLDKAKEYHVMGVPTVIFFDKDDKEISRANDIESVKKVIENKSLSDV